MRSLPILALAMCSALFAQTPQPDTVESATPAAQTTPATVIDPAPAAPIDPESPSSAVPLPPVWGAIELLGSSIEPGQRQRLSWSSGSTFTGEPMATPVNVLHGTNPGKVLCLTGGVHGDELNGVEVIRRVAAMLDPTELNGTLIAVPIVNMAGFARGSRYLPDRRDLNRFFPGNPNGSSASRIAFDFYQQIVRRCDALVDFHTGSFERSNLPQVRGDMRIPAVVDLTRLFGATAVLHTPGATGMLRRAATDHGIPAVTFELGAPIRLEPVEIEHGVTAIETLMNNLGMTASVRMWREPQPIFYESRWVRAIASGMLFADVRLGDRVRAGQRLGRIVNPVNDRSIELSSPVRGRVLGMALNQVVLPGFAAFHIGEEASEAELIRDARVEPEPASEELERMDEGSEGVGDSVEGSTEQVDAAGDPGG